EIAQRTIDGSLLLFAESVVFPIWHKTDDLPEGIVRPGEIEAFADWLLPGKKTASEGLVDCGNTRILLVLVRQEISTMQRHFHGLEKSGTDRIWNGQGHVALAPDRLTFDVNGVRTVIDGERKDVRGCNRTKAGNCRRAIHYPAVEGATFG